MMMSLLDPIRIILQYDNSYLTFTGNRFPFSYKNVELPHVYSTLMRFITIDRETPRNFYENSVLCILIKSFI